MFTARSESLRILRHVTSLGKGESTIISVTGADAGSAVKGVINDLGEWNVVHVFALPWQAQNPGWLREAVCTKAKVDHLERLDTAQAQVAIVVEKAQWVDVASLHAMVEWARGTRHATVALISATDVPDMLDNFHQIADMRVHLPPLRINDIATLALTYRGVQLNPDVCARMLEVTGGDTELVRDILDAASEDHWRSTHPFLPVPQRWRTAFEQRCGQDATLIQGLQAAAITSHYDALVQLLGNAEPITLAIERGLLQSVPEGSGRIISFTHPTDLAVTRASTAPATWRRLHAAASDWFAAHQQVTESFLHQAKSLDAADDELAQRMFQHASELSTEGLWREAFLVFHRASIIAGNAELEEKCYLHAIEALIADSDIPQASQHVRQLTSVRPNAHIDSIRGYLALHQGHSREATMLISRSWSALDSPSSVDAESRARAASRHVLLKLCEWQPQEVTNWGTTARHWALPQSALYSESHYISLIGEAATTGTIPDLTPLTWETETMAQRRHMAAGWIYTVHDDPFSARQHLSAAGSGQGSERIATWMDAWRARSYLLLGDTLNAEKAVERGLARCERYGITFLKPLLLWTACVIAGLRGDWALASIYSNQLTLSHDAFPIQQIPSAMARLYLGVAQNDQAAVQRAGTFLTELSSTVDTSQPGFWPWRDLWTVHLINTGQLEQAEAIIETAAQRNSSIVSYQAKIAMTQARLHFAHGDAERGIATYDEALAMIESLSLPLYSARVLFDYGQALRRQGKRRLADDLLSRASEYYTAMGADHMVAQCGRERRAGGVGSRIPSIAGLTPQEMEIATLVAEGGTNKDVAGALFLSAKTVEYHLTRVYRKLGIRTRAELGRALDEL